MRRYSSAVFRTRARGLVALLALVLSPGLAWAQIPEEAQQAHDMVDDLPLDPAGLFAGDDDNLTLLPGTAGEQQFTMDQLFGGADAFGEGMSAAELSAAGDDMDSLYAMGREEHVSLHGQSGANHLSQAYGTVNTVREEAIVELSGDDAIFVNVMENGYDNIEAVTDTFADCEETVSTIPVTQTDYLESEYVCEEVVRPEGTCEATHDLELTGGSILVSDTFSVQAVQTFSYSVSPPGDFCSYAVRDVQVIGIMSSSEDSTFTLTVSPPDCDGGGGTITIDDFDNGNNSTFDYNVDFEVRFRAVVHDEWVYDGDLCEQTAALVLEDEFCSGEMVATSSALGELDGVQFLVGDDIWEGISPPPFDINERLIDRNALTVEIDVDDCHFEAGTMCWTDVYGVEHCETVPETDDLDNCDIPPNCSFERSECVEGASGTETGICFVTSNVYRCVDPVTYTTHETERSHSCVGDLQCMGTECVDPQYESNDGMVQALTMFEAMDQIMHDLECESLADLSTCRVFSGEAINCKKALFGIVDCCNNPTIRPTLGDWYQMLALGTFPTTASSVPGYSGEDSAGGANGAGAGAKFHEMQSFGPDATSYEDGLNTSLVTGTTSLSGESSTATDLPDLIAEQLEAEQDYRRATVEELYQRCFGQVGCEMSVESLWVCEEPGESIIAGGAVNATCTIVPATTAPTNPSGTEFGGGIFMSTMNRIQAAFMVLRFWDVILGTIWPCTEAEFELDHKKDLNSCRYVGSYCQTAVIGICIESRESYCCFNSPFARIINEQARNETFHGSARNPQCRGFTIAELGSLDWSQIDLSEWTATLIEGGQIPSAPGIGPQLTGSQSPLNYGGRADASGRTADHLSTFDGESVYDAAKTELQTTYAPPPEAGGGG